MTSRLDPYFSQIFQKLNQEGRSYHFVREYLKSEGIEISRQALWSWHTRKSQKLLMRSLKYPSNIQSRGQSLNSVNQGWQGQTAYTEELSEPLAKVAPAAAPNTMSLRAQIEAEEKRRSAGQQFPVAFLSKENKSCPNRGTPNGGSAAADKNVMDAS